MFKVNNKKKKNVTEVVLVFLLLSLNKFYTLFSISIIHFEQVNVNWEVSCRFLYYQIDF